jgi:hypothetical protein
MLDQTGSGIPDCRQDRYADFGVPAPDVRDPLVASVALGVSLRLGVTLMTWLFVWPGLGATLWILAPRVGPGLAGMLDFGIFLGLFCWAGVTAGGLRRPTEAAVRSSRRVAIALLVDVGVYLTSGVVLLSRVAWSELSSVAGLWFVAILAVPQVPLIVFPAIVLHQIRANEHRTR